MAGIGIIIGFIALPLMLLSILLPVALVIALQVWLCKRKNRWLGLILPAVSLLFSLLLVFSFGAFGWMNSSFSSGGTVLEQDGQVVQRTITEHGTTTVYDGEGNVMDQYPAPNSPDERSSAESMAAAAAAGLLFLVCNIPTVVLGGIWLHYKNRRDFQDEIRKMNIQDLG